MTSIVLGYILGITLTTSIVINLVLAAIVWLQRAEIKRL